MPRLRYPPESQMSISRGFSTLEQAVGPTIGPVGRPVAISRSGRSNVIPELLDDGATIARRMTGVEDRFENMGFMLARQAAWRQRVEAGDGTATVVAVLAEAHRRLHVVSAAGVNRADLQTGIHLASNEILDRIDTFAVELDPNLRKAFLQTVSPNERATNVVVEAIEVLGPDAVIVTRDSKSRTIDIEYVEGALWESSGKMAPLLIESGNSSIRLPNPSIVLWDGAVSSVDELASLLAILKSDSSTRFILVARSFSGEALGLLQRNVSPHLEVVPVCAPHAGQQQAWAFEDLSTLTGAKVLRPEAGDSLSRVPLEAIGISQRAALGSRFLNIMVPKGRQPAINRQKDRIRHLLDKEVQDNTWDHLQLRLGRLQQGMGVVWVGASTTAERDVLSRTIEQSLSRLRAATKHGVIPGGGATLLSVIKELTYTQCQNQNMTFLALARACERPAWWIAKNAGYDANATVARGRVSAPTHGFEARTGKFVDLFAAGIVDPVSTIRHAVQIAISTAALANDCSVLVKRELSLDQAEMTP